MQQQTIDTDRRRTLGFGLSVAGLAASAALPRRVRAAEGTIRIAEQFGIIYLLLNIAQDQKLIEKHGRDLGIDVRPQWVKLPSGAAVNDALLSGQIDIAAAGLSPLLSMWDRTRGAQNVRGVAALGNFPYWLVSNNPKVQSIADFTERDRIALPAVGVSFQARILQLAAARTWGDGQFNRLDRISVAMPHPEAAQAILKGGGDLSAHFGNPPYQEQALGSINSHIVLKSYDVLGGPSTAAVVYATEQYRSENPVTYTAFVRALVEAAQLAVGDPEKGAESFLRVSKLPMDRKTIARIIASRDAQPRLTPQNTLTMAQFMHRIGAIKNQPTAVRDYFFNDPHNLAGT